MLRSTLVVLCLLATSLGAPRVRPRLDGRIIGGTAADISQYPWQISLHSNGGFICGGSVISSSWALTAAHCIYDGFVNQFTIRVGSSTTDSGGSLHQVGLGYYHGLFDDSTLDYDIGVLQVTTSFPLGSGVQAVGLPADGYDPPAGLAVVATGFGVTSTGGSLPPTLQQVSISVQDRSVCNAIFAGITERMVCAGVAGSSVCNGDSGGPLVSGSTQVGIVSWGSQTCEEAPALYSNVGNLRAWITSTTGV